MWGLKVELDPGTCQGVHKALERIVYEAGVAHLFKPAPAPTAACSSATGICTFLFPLVGAVLIHTPLTETTAPLPSYFPSHA